jgi:hypothetical protein
VTDETLYRVTGASQGRPFCAGLVVRGDRVVRAAPILWRLVMRQRIDYVCRKVRSRRWSIERVDDNQTQGEGQTEGQTKAAPD